MNRDWAWSSQREVRARVAEYRKWNPQVFVDFHEMGYQSSYFFPPDARPVNANLPKDVDTWLEKFGRAERRGVHEKGMDVLHRRGVRPLLSRLRRLLAVAARRDRDDVRSGRPQPRRHRPSRATTARSTRWPTASPATTRPRMATLRTASENREGLLQYTYEMMRKQVASGQNTYLLQPDSPNFRPLIEMLQRQSIAMSQLGAPLTIKASRIDSDAADIASLPRRHGRHQHAPAPRRPRADAARALAGLHARATSKSSRNARTPTSRTSSTTSRRGRCRWR